MNVRDNAMFNGSRLTFARKFRKFTIRHLADVSAVSLRTISSYENSTDLNPRDEIVKSLADALSFPESFFHGDELEHIEAEHVSFRALSKMTALDRDQNLCFGELAYTLSKWIDKYFSLPAVDVPMYGNELVYSRAGNGKTKKETTQARLIEGLAERLRADWGLGQLPIKNLLNLVESKGVMVFSLPENNSSTDGFSFWRGGRPFILYNQGKTSERSRFDIAHELGHLVLHGDERYDDSKNKEREANTFASAFLMPGRGILGNYPRNAAISSFLPYKQKWNVSLAAFNYRLHSLNLISDWTYRSNCIEISKLGRNSEPSSMPPEQPQIVYKVLSALKREGKTTQTIADELCMNPKDLDILLFGMLTSTHRTPLRIVS